MKLILLLVSALGCFLATNVHGFKKRMNKGTEVRDGQFRYVVGIVTTKEDGQKVLCGGAIIGDKWILTAAHCFTTPTEFGKIPRHFSAKSIDVYPGTHRVNIHDKTINSVDVSKVYIHAKYLVNTVADIAIVKLRSNLNIRGNSGRLQMLNTPVPQIRQGKEDYNLYLHETAEVAGFGRDPSANPENSGNLKKLNVKVIKFKDCQDGHGQQNKESEHLCGRPAQESSEHKAMGPCQGDSGSPLVLRSAVIGIVREGSKNCDDTGAKPGLYVRVSTYKDFIEKVTKNKVIDAKKIYVYGHSFIRGKYVRQ